MEGHTMPRSRVIDDRRVQFFMCDNAIIDDYAADLGPYALAVYVALLRYAGRKDECFPSLKTLGDQLGMGKDSVIKAIDTLKRKQLISVKHRRDKAGDAASNLYFIREVVGHTDNLVGDIDNGSRPHRQRVVGHTDTKNIQLKKTHQEEDGAVRIAQTMRDEPPSRCVGYPMRRGERPRYCELHRISHCAAEG
jgi:hypothetical protein